jgi:hypothetical protein
MAPTGYGFCCMNFIAVKRVGYRTRNRWTTRKVEWKSSFVRGVVVPAQAPALLCHFLPPAAKFFFQLPESQGSSMIFNEWVVFRGLAESCTGMAMSSAAGVETLTR